MALDQNPFAARLDAYRNAGNTRAAADQQVLDALTRIRGGGIGGQVSTGPRATFASMPVAQVSKYQRPDAGSLSNPINQGINLGASTLEGAVNTAGGALDRITPFNGPLETATDKAIGQGTGAVNNAIGDTAATLTGAISDTSDAIRNGIHNLDDVVKDPIGQAQNGAQQLATNVESGLNRVGNAVQGGVTAIGNQVQALGQNPNVQATAQKIAEAAKTLGLTPEAMANLDAMFSRSGGIMAALGAPPGSPLRTQVSSAIAQAQSSAGNLLSTAAANAAKAAQAATQSAATAAGSAANQIGNQISNAGDTLNRGAKKVESAVKSVAKKVRIRR